MKLTIKYFGVIAEITECHQEVLEFSKSSVEELLDLIFEKYPGIKTKEFQVAMHNEIAEKDAVIATNEIALLPPFAGG